MDVSSDLLSISSIHLIYLLKVLIKSIVRKSVNRWQTLIDNENSHNHGQT
jgi:hypothetical protein